MRKTYFFQVEHTGSNVVTPLIFATRTLALDLPISVHDGLKDGGEGGHANAGADEDGVLGPEDVAGRSAKWAVHKNLIKQNSSDK